MSTLQETAVRLKKYRFYKYRTMHAWGYTKWEIVRLPEGETPKSFFDEMAREHSWSDKFRGVYWRKITPPKDWLEKEILDLRRRANYTNRMADDFCWLLQKL